MPKKLRGKSAAAAKPRSTAAKPPARKRATAAKAAPEVSKTASKPSRAARSDPKATQAGGALVEGAAAPAFDLPRDGGGRTSLADYRGQNLVLFFYPRANTPGCTREAMDFSRLKSAFTACNTAVIGLSADGIKAQNSFRDKNKLTIPLVSDEQKEALVAYGAWGNKVLYGRHFEGILRTTVLIDPKGRVARVWRNVKVDGHADAVLAACQDL